MSKINFFHSRVRLKKISIKRVKGIPNLRLHIKGTKQGNTFLPKDWRNRIIRG